MSTRKIYQSIGHLNLSMQVLVDNHKVEVIFSGGTRQPKVNFGTYTTEDSLIQKALESHPEFKKSYKLIMVGNKSVNQEEAKRTLPEQIAVLQEEKAELQRQLEEATAGLTKAIEDAVNYATEKANALIEGLREENAVLQAQVNELLGSLNTPVESTPAPENGPVEELKPEIINLDVINGQQAKEYLVKEHGIDAKRLPNVVSIRNKAEALNIKFPNWKDK